MTTATQRISVEFWPMADDAVLPEAKLAELEVERDETNPDRIALHTFVDDRGSVTSYYVDRDSAIRLAHALLGASLLR